METGDGLIRNPQVGKFRWRRLLLPIAALLLGWALLATWFTAIASPIQRPARSDLGLLYFQADYDLRVSKSTLPTTYFTVGDNNYYIITVSRANDGTITEAPRIRDTLPAGMTVVEIVADQWTCLNIPAGEVSCSYTGPINQDIQTFPNIQIQVDIDPDVEPFVVNTATLENLDSDPSNNTATTTTPVDSVDLEIEKSVDPRYADVGEDVTYNIIIYNHGPFVASSVVVTDTLSTYLNYGTPSVTGGNPPTISGTNLEWTIDTLGIGLSETLVMTATPLPNSTGREIINTAAVIGYSNRSDWEPDNNEDSAAFFISGLFIDKAVNADEASVGDNFVYTINVANNGTQAASSVYVRDSFDAALDVVTATYQVNGGTWIPFSTGNSMNRLIGTMNPGDSASVAVTVRGNYTIIISDTVTNTARVTASPNVVRHSDVVTTTLYSASDLAADKSDGPDELTPGETFSYTIRLKNIGSITATNIIVTDTLSNYLRFTSFDASGLVMTPTYTSTLTRAWEIERDLSPQSSSSSSWPVTFRIGARVLSDAPIGAAVNNTVYASTTTTETWFANNTHVSDDSIVVEPPQPSDMSIVLSRTPPQAAIGEYLYFTVAVRNRGDQAANDVRIYDIFPTVLDITGVSTNRGTATTNASTREVTVNVSTLTTNQVVTVTISTRVNSTLTQNQEYTHRSSLTWSPNRTLQSNSVRYRVLVSTLPGTGGAGPTSESPFSALTLSSGVLLVGLGLAALLYSLWTRTHRPLWTVWFGRAGVILLVAGLIIVFAGLAIRSETSRQQQPQLAVIGGTKPPVATLPPTSTHPPSEPSSHTNIEQWGPTPTPESLPDYPIPTPSAAAGQPGTDDSPVKRLIIPRLGVDALVKYVPFNGQTWLIGGLKGEVAWMGDTSWPGLGGNTGLAGHIDLFDGSDGPFRYLNDLESGDEVILYTEKNMYFYKVSEQAVVNDGDMSVLESTTDPKLTLITCTGWDDELRLYIQRLVVFADLAEVKPIREPQSTLPLDSIRGESHDPKAEKAAVAQTAAAPIPYPRVAYQTLASQLSEAGINPYIPGRKAILVDQASQLMHLFEDGKQVRTLPVSSGTSQNYTPAYRGYVKFYVGVIKSDEGLLADHAWYLFSNTGRIYIHGSPYATSPDGSKEYIDLEMIGRETSSHGCIRLFPEDAEWLRDWNPEGAAILITAPYKVAFSPQ